MGFPLAVDCAVCVGSSRIGFGAFVNFNLPIAGSPSSIDAQLRSQRKSSYVWIIEWGRNENRLPLCALA